MRGTRNTLSHFYSKMRDSITDHKKKFLDCVYDPQVKEIMYFPKLPKVFKK